MAKQRLLSPISGGINVSDLFDLKVKEIYNGKTIPFYGKYIDGFIYGLSTLSTISNNQIISDIASLDSTIPNSRLFYNKILFGKFDKSNLSKIVQFTLHSIPPHSFLHNSAYILLPYSSDEMFLVDKDTLTYTVISHNPIPEFYRNSAYGLNETHIFYKNSSSVTVKYRISDAYVDTGVLPDGDHYLATNDRILCVNNGTFYARGVNSPYTDYLIRSPGTTFKTNYAHYHQASNTWLLSTTSATGRHYLVKAKMGEDYSIAGAVSTIPLSLKIDVVNYTGSINYSVYGDDIYCVINENTIVKLDYETLEVKASIQVPFTIDVDYKLIALEDGVLCYSREINATVKIG